MRRRHVLSSLAAAAAVALTLPGAGPAGAAAASPAAARTAGSASGTASEPAGSAPATVRLPTGDVVTVRTMAGRQLVTVSPVGTGPAARNFVTLRVAGDTYVVPRLAMARIGHDFSLGQFDVTRRAAGRGVGGDPLSVHGVSARFPQSTVTFRAIDPTGERDVSADLLVVNVDDLRTFAGVTFFNHGVAKLSLPAGHYAATSSFFVPTSAETGTIAVTELPEFSVTGRRSVTIDGRRATSEVSARTPQPAAAVETDISIGRSDRNGLTAAYGVGTTGSDLSLRVSPTHRVSVGQLHYYPYFRKASPQRTYDLEFPFTGVIPVDQRFAVKDSQLAANPVSYHATAPHEGADTRFSFLPWEFGSFRSLSPLPLPARRTEYVIGNPHIRWQQDAISVVESTRRGFFIAGEILDRVRTYRPGTSIPQTYFAAPAHPAPTPNPQYGCTACRTGKGLQLVIYPFGDNFPGHAGYPGFSFGRTGLTERTAFQLYSGSTVLAKAPFPVGTFRLPAGAGTYRAMFSTLRRGPSLSLSTRITSEWTFRSAPAAGTRQIPLLFARYDLPSDLRDRVAAGPTTVDLMVGHQSEADAVPVRSATLRVSFDGGTTYRPATVTDLGGGHFRARYTTPATGSPTFALTATDAAGGRLRQTITNAYVIGSSS